MVDIAGAPSAAEAYFPEVPANPSGEPWVPEAWQDNWAPLARLNAAQVMDEFRIGTPLDEVARKLPVLEARAQARWAAETRPAPKRMAAPDASGIEDIETRTVYSKFFRVDECDLKVPMFDGRSAPEIERVVFLAVDAVTVLPYDPKRDRVLLIEQFRIGPHARGDAAPWLLEAIAGRVDGGESWENAAHREALEEAGLDQVRLRKVAEFYPSTGANSEFIIAYIGLADLPDGIEGIYGQDAENEDIRTHLLHYADFANLMDAGHFRNAPLLVSALWLALNRDSLRAAANGA